MARARRNMSYKLTGPHDRRSRDLPFNAELVEVEVDNPLALDPDEKIVAMRSTCGSIAERCMGSWASTAPGRPPPSERCSA